MARYVPGSYGEVVALLQPPHTQAGSIKKACRAVADIIEQDKDNLRAFFQACFPTLLTRLFGFDDQEPSWFSLIAKDSSREEDARELLHLLDPAGPLFAAMHSADAGRLIQFSFPLERLPAHTQELLKAPAGRAELEQWPQYRGRVRSDAVGGVQVALGMLDYYLCWTAFYVLRGSRSAETRGRGQSGFGGGGGGGPGQQLYRGIRNYGSQIVATLRDFDRDAGASHPYFQLLRSYLTALLPRTCDGGAPALSLSRGADGGTPGETLLSILVEFWLTDSGEPLPSAPAGGVASPLTAAGAAGGPGAAAAAAAAAAAPGAADLLPPLGGGGAGGSAGVGFLSSSGGGAAAAVIGGGDGVGGGAGHMGGAAPQKRGFRSFSFQPPAEELVQAVGVLVRYATTVEPCGADQRPPAPAQGRTPWLPVCPVATFPPPGGRLAAPLLPAAPFHPSVQALSRKLYRFLRRALAQWPLTTSASLTPLLKLWLVVIAPWRTPSWQEGVAARLSARAHPRLAAGAAAASSLSRWGNSVLQREERWERGGAPDQRTAPPKGTYGPEWRPHVLAHLPFYLLLLPHFVDLCYSRMSYKSDAAVKDLYRVLRELEACPALVAELRSVERAYNAYLASSPRRATGEYADLLPWLAEQACDWEAAAAAGAPTAPPMLPSPAARLFSTEWGGPASSARGLMRAADTQGVSGTLRGALRLAVEAVLPLGELAEEEAAADAAAAAAPPLHDGGHLPPVGRWQAVAYKGDPMLRPIASNEVALLVRGAVAVSRAVNGALGLHGGYGPGACGEEEPPETVVQEWLALLRRHRVRLNLRPLAEVQTLAWLAALLVFGYLAALFIATPLDDEGADGAAAASGLQPPVHHSHSHHRHPHHWEAGRQAPAVAPTYASAYDAEYFE